jgi:hypothetical protein
MNGIFVPIVGFVSVAAMFIVFSLLNSWTQFEIQRTLRTALEKGAPLTTELVSQMNTNRPTRKTDLRRGIIIMSIGVAALVAGPITRHLQEFATVAVFPIFVGIGYLLVWKLERGQGAA